MAIGTTIAIIAAFVAANAAVIGGAVAVAGIGLQVIGAVTKNSTLMKIGKIMGYVGAAVGVAGFAAGAFSATAGGAVGGTAAGGTGVAATAAPSVAEPASAVIGQQLGQNVVSAGTGAIGGISGGAAPAGVVDVAAQAAKLAGNAAQPIMSAAGGGPTNAPTQNLGLIGQGGGGVEVVGGATGGPNDAFVKGYTDQIGMGMGNKPVSNSWVPAWLKEVNPIVGSTILAGAGSAISGMFQSDAEQKKLTEEKRQFNLLRGDRNAIVNGY